MTAALIGVDLGATNVKAALVAPDGLCTRRVHEPVGHARDEASMLSLLAELIASLAPPPGSPVGVAVAGVLDVATARIRESPNYPLWADFRLGDRLAEAIDRPVTLCNDANAAILGEVVAGAGRGSDNAVGFTLGTGVGGAIVLGGRLYTGERGMAGELGHLTVIPEGRPCGCGNRGCLERYAGAIGIAESMREAGIADPEWQAAAAKPAEAVAWLAGRAAQGQPTALSIFAGAGRALGQVMAGLVHTLDVPTFILTGGVARAYPFMAAAIETELDARCFKSMREGVRVLPGSLGDDGALIGATVLARQRWRG